MSPKEILNKWKECVNNANLEGIINLYESKSILIPTFSSEILSEKKQIKEYFAHLVEEQKGSVEIQKNSIFEHSVGGNNFLLSGNYFFKLKGKEIIPARFTFLINPSKDNPIKHHHSSKIINS